MKREKVEDSPGVARELAANMPQVKVEAATPALSSRPSGQDGQKCESGPTKAGTKTTRRQK